MTTARTLALGLFALFVAATSGWSAGELALSFGFARTLATVVFGAVTTTVLLIFVRAFPH